MKRLILFIGILIIAGAGMLLIKDKFEQEPKNVLPATTNNVTAIPSPTIALKQSVVIDVKGTPIRVSWAEVNPEEVDLYSNLKAQQLSEQIYVDKSCQILVNGGFYSKEDTHLGLFISNSETISKTIQSDTLNGFLSINNSDLIIGANPPEDSPRIALQSGPLLIKNGQPLPLAINNDEPNRRIAAATTDDDQLLFLAFYKDSSDFNGPLLGQLPEIINLFEKQTGIKITDAINLDGGSASIFITNYVRLVELTHIGSYFCIK